MAEADAPPPPSKTAETAAAALETEDGPYIKAGTGRRKMRTDLPKSKGGDGTGVNAGGGGTGLQIT